MNKSDVVIIGGGLAGLSLSIVLARKGHSVTLLEKNTYPFHRVCGEYISLESYQFLVELGIPLAEMNLTLIQQLQVSSPTGSSLQSPLPLGGIGISRFLLDEELAKIARTTGVKLLEHTRVESVLFENNTFHIKTATQQFETTLCIGSFGKKANLDVQWERPFTKTKPSKLNNYVGIKYHIQSDFPKDAIALHNFKDGYCGISAIENNKHCLCYLTTAQNLKNAGNDIKRMEQETLSKNPFLKDIFQNATFLFDNPVAISQISFEPKSLIENHILMLGDAAGVITPLCGNGMSMALHGSKLLSNLIDTFLKGEITRNSLESLYLTQWKRLFSQRLWVGRRIQALFGNELQTDLLVKGIRPFPFLLKKLIQSTHGKPF